MDQGAFLVARLQLNESIQDYAWLCAHNVLTLHQWVARLADHADEIKATTSDVVYRIWRPFMSFSA